MSASYVGCSICRRSSSIGRAWPQRISVVCTAAVFGPDPPGDPADPLLRQVLPLDAETLAAEGFTADPVGDRSATLSRAVAQVRGPGVDGNNWGLRRPLPVLFSPAFPLSNRAQIAGRLAAGDRADRGRCQHSRSDSQRRRSADVGRSTARRTGRAAGRDSAFAAAANPHAAADHDSRSASTMSCSAGCAARG